jgi:hypothetical protein
VDYLPYLFLGELSMSERALFSNSQWNVFEWGLKVRANFPWYIEKKRFRELRRPGICVWPLVVATKLWADLRVFEEAFEAAMDLLEIDRSGIDWVTTWNEAYEIDRMTMKSPEHRIGEKVVI